MKKFVSLIALTFMAMNAIGAKPKLVSRIDPTDWYVGLKDASLQLMVYGTGIRDAEVTVGRTDVSMDSLVRLDSPNYLLVYLSLKGAAAGELPLTFKVGRKQQTVNYLLKTREKNGAERMGFTNEDVLYMLMPDRFAQGPNHPLQVKGLNTYKEDRNEPSLRHGGDLEGIWTTSMSLALRRCGSHRCWKTTRPTTASSRPIMATPRRTTTVWIRASGRMPTIDASSTRLTPRG